MIARDETEEDKVRLSHIPIFDPRQPHSIPGTPYVPKEPVVEEKKEEEEASVKVEPETKDEEMTSDDKSATTNDVEATQTESANGETEAKGETEPSTKDPQVENAASATAPCSEGNSTPSEKEEAVNSEVERNDEEMSKSSDDSKVMLQPPAEAAKEQTCTAAPPDAIKTAVIVPNPVKPPQTQEPAKVIIGNGSVAGEKLPPPANEPLNLTMGGAAATADIVPKSLNNLPPPPATIAIQNSGQEIQAVEDINVKKNQDPERQSSNGAVPAM